MLSQAVTDVASDSQVLLGDYGDFMNHFAIDVGALLLKAHTEHIVLA